MENRIHLPALRPGNRKREYLEYSKIDRARVVYAYLTRDVSTRILDDKILCVPHNYKGYKSWSILAYLGIRKDFRNLFHDYTEQEVLDAFVEAGPAYQNIVKVLRIEEIAPWDE